MMRNYYKPIIFLALFAFILNSCVTQKKYQELEAIRKKCDEESSILKNQNIDLATKVNELKAQFDKASKQNSELIASNKELTDKYNDASAKLLRLKETNDTLEDRNKKLMYGKSAEIRKIITELNLAQEKALKQQDSLRKVGNELLQKKQSLDLLTAQLAEKQSKLLELQNILSKKDSIVKALKKKVQDALMGFENKGLTINQKNGKVYVSMDETLLFSSGSFEVQPAGVEALKKLAKVLESNADINVMVEGHTDNVPYKSSGQQINDNWDLSVMRATAVSKILLKNSTIDPKRITSAGRSEYLPIDKANTKEARSKNRRTEIILTPKLDELFNIIESN